MTDQERAKYLNDLFGDTANTNRQVQKATAIKEKSWWDSLGDWFDTAGKVIKKIKDFLDIVRPKT